MSSAVVCIGKFVNTASGSAGMHDSESSAGSAFALRWFGFGQIPNQRQALVSGFASSCVSTMTQPSRNRSSGFLARFLMIVGGQKGQKKGHH